MCGTPKKSGPVRGVGSDDGKRGQRQSQASVETADVDLRVALEAQIDADAEVDKPTTQPILHRAAEIERERETSKEREREEVDAERVS